MIQEDLLPAATPLNVHNKNKNFNIQEFNNEATLNFGVKNRCFTALCYLIVISIFIFGLVLLLIFKPYSTFTTIYGIFTIILVVCLFCMCQKSAQIQMIKNILNNQLIIKVKKIFGSIKYIFPLENVFIHCQETPNKSTKITVINTLKNPSEIDLDNSKIQISPIPLIFSFLEHQNNCKTYQLLFGRFVEQQKFENNIIDEINKYARLYNKSHFISSEKILLDKYMKFTEHFYTLIISQFSYERRVDFVYSNDFERLFIGLVNKTNYINTFLIHCSQIDKFEVYSKKIATEDSDYNDYYLKIIYNSQQPEQIKIFNSDSDSIYLNKMVLLLNGKLNDLRKKKENNYKKASIFSDIDNDHTPKYT